MLTRTLLIGAALALNAVAAHAQVANVPAGTRVRVTAPGELERRTVGRVVQSRGDTLSVATSDGIVRVPVTSITALDVSRGRSASRGAQRGALIGLPVGAAIGVVGALTGEDCTTYSFNGTSSSCARVSAGGAAILTGGLGVLGAGVGAAIGALVGRERWEASPVSRASLRSLPHGRTGIGLAYRL